MCVCVCVCVCVKEKERDTETETDREVRGVCVLGEGRGVGRKAGRRVNMAVPHACYDDTALRTRGIRGDTGETDKTTSACRPTYHQPVAGTGLLSQHVITVTAL